MITEDAIHSFWAVIAATVPVTAAIAVAGRQTHARAALEPEIALGEE